MIPLLPHVREPAGEPDVCAYCCEEWVDLLTLYERDECSVRLRAEVERLRAEVTENEGVFRVLRRREQEAQAERDEARAEAATMRAWAEEAAKAENENAEDAKRERAAVVAWLRLRERQIENWPPGGMNEISLTYNIIATSIEHGEHGREEEK